MLLSLLVCLCTLTVLSDARARPASPHARGPVERTVRADTIPPLDRAAQALGRGDAAGALRMYREHLEAHPDSYEAQYGLARALSASGRHDEAAARFSELLRRDPENADARVSRGYAFLHGGRYDEAAADFERVAHAFPAYADAWRGLADAHRHAGRPVEALQTYERWMQALPDSPEPYLARGQAYRTVGRLAEARADLRAAQARGADPAAAAALQRALSSGRQAADPAGGPLTVSAGYAAEVFRRDQPAWQTYEAAVRYRSGGLSLGLAYLRTTRFGRWDDALVVENYADLWSRAYLHTRLQAAPDPSFLPDIDYGLELFQGLASGWEPSLSYRRMNFPDGSVNLFGAGLGLYVGSWYLRARTSAARVVDQTALSFTGAARRYLGSTDTFVEARAGYGREVVTFGAGPQYALEETYAAAVRAATHFTAQLGAGLAAVYFFEAPLPPRGGFSLYILTRL